jgi:TRAP-type C4-dicarboxylate transport system substrate-binding protein
MTSIRALVGALLIVSLAATMATVEARTLKVNSYVQPGSVPAKQLERFKQLVEEGSQGELEIRVFTDGALGGQQESLENLRTGTLELYAEALSYYATLIPEELGITTLMYFFSDNEHLRRYLTSDFFQKAHEEKLIKKHGVRFISTEFRGFRGPYRVFVSTKPIMRVEDLKGIKMRLWPNDVIIRQWRHLGAVPAVLAWTEVYLALRQGTIEAVTAPLSVLPQTKFTEVAEYVTELRQFPQVLPMTVSEKVWQTLSSEQQQLLVDAANQSLAEYTEQVFATASANKETMIRDHDAVFMQVNTDPFREAMAPFYQTLIEEGAIDKAAFDAANALR